MLMVNSSNLMRRLILGAVVGVGCVLAVNFLAAGKARAFTSTTISNVAPMPGSAQGNNGVDLQPYFDVSQGLYDGIYTYAKLYVPVTSTSATLRVLGGGGVCPIEYGNPQADYTIYSLTAEENYPSTGNPVVDQINSRSNGGSTCRDLVMTIDNSRGVASVIEDHTAYKVYYFEARYANIGTTGTKLFRLQLDTNPGAPGGLIGYSRQVLNYGGPTGRSYFGISLLSNDATFRPPGVDTWDFRFEFAPRCSDNSPDAVQLNLYDADNGLYNPQNLSSTLDSAIKLTNPRVWNQQESWTADEMGTPGVNYDSKNLDFLTDRDHAYRYSWNGTSWLNTIQIQIPYDQFDAQISVVCDSPPPPPPPPTVVTETKPYLKAYGAHVVTGGWFDNGDVSCGGNANYQEAYPTTLGNNPYPGGIRTFGVVERAGATFNTFGTMSKYGSRSLGLVEGSGFNAAGGTIANRTTGSGYGFFTNQLHPTPSGTPPAIQHYYSPTYLTLSNGSPPTTSLHYPPSTDYPAVGAKYAGGILGGVDAAVNDQCIPDFYGTTQGSPASLSALSPVTNLAALLSTQQIMIPGAGQTAQIGNGARLDIALGQRLTIYVEGDVYIGSNIVYAPGYDYSEPEEVPYFSLIVKGNIYVGKNVDRLEGFYVAQPDTSIQSTIDATGHFITCAERSPASAPPAAVSYARLGDECNNRLLVNGAVAAKRAVLLRSNGSIEEGRANENFTDGVTYPANSAGRRPNNGFTGSGFRAGDTAAEVFNYIPEMMIATPNFAGGGDLLNRFEVERIYSLPPVF